MGTRLQKRAIQIYIEAYRYIETYRYILTEEGECDLLADTPCVLEAPNHTQLEASLPLGVRHGEFVDARQQVHHPVVV